jgi:hypothetical protein
MYRRVLGTLDTFSRSKEEAPMVNWKWEGRLIDYALIVTLVGFEAVIAGCFRGAFENTALAYIDPGVGAMIVQAIAAAFFGALFYFKNMRKAIGRFFLRLAGRAPAPQQVPAQAAAAETPAEKK